MKKRILALALAGTTAFSVFGAAISANAWDFGNTTDTRYDVDAYASYTPVAQKIEVTKKAESDLTEYTVDGKTVYVNPNAKENDTYTDANGNKHPVYKTVEDYKIATYGVRQEVYTIVPASANDALANLGNCKEIELIRVYRNGENYIRWAGVSDDQIQEWKNGPNNYTVEKLNGPYYVSNDDYKTITLDTNTLGVLGDNTYVYYDEEVVDPDEIQHFTTVSDINTVEPAADHYKSYNVQSVDYVKLTVQNGEIVEADKEAEGAIGVEDALKVLSVATLTDGSYLYKSTPYATANELIKALVGETAKPTVQYVNDDKITLDTVIDVSDANSNSIEVTYKYKDNTGTYQEATVASPYSKWYFNSDMTGDASVEPYEVTTSIEKGKIQVIKEEKPTVYAYDFIPMQVTAGNVNAISSAWNYGTATDTATNLLAYGRPNTTNELIAEKGEGNTSWGIRASVVSEWIDFLDELAINKDNGYDESWSEFRENYLDMFYQDAYYDRFTGEQIGTVNVDLYNIEGLLWDIYKLSSEKEIVKPANWADRQITGWYNANTSEMVYLMQQYDKYIGEYIDKAEVASDEWGDLLLSILDAATESDFKSAPEYRKYQNEVEDLRTAYEIATTTNMIHQAEEDMYALLISANNVFKASSTAPSKTDLNSALNDLYFNAGSIPPTYTVDPSTKGNAKYTNYNYYVAALSVSNPNYSDTDQNLTFTSTLQKGYYSLYPMVDYIDYDTTTPNEVYAGNNSSEDYTGKWWKPNYATEEYEWFWNVYQLAARMNANGIGTSGNTKQGSVDAVNDALADAVAELAVTTTPASMDVGAMNDAVEEYAGKIESDYDAGYYAKYVQANDYAENVAEGKWQTRIAAMINGVAGEALTYQGTQVTVTKNDMKTVEDAIKNGKTALEAIKADKDYNAAQVNALNEALDNAEDLVSLYEGTYSTKRDDQSVNKNYSKLVGDKDQMVKSDLTAAIEAIDAAINYSEIVMGWSQNDAGKWMYGTEEGYLNNGWNKIGKTWFYFNADNTAKQSEWFQENGTWYWFNSNCGAACGWAKVDGSWYYFKGNNAMKTGWEKVDGNWYYMASSGKMVTGWCEVNGKWYYFSKESNSLGQMLYSTTVDGYKLGADGAWIK